MSDIGLWWGLLARRLSPSDSISYSDFITIILAAVALLLTLLAFILAIFGFVGWASIDSKVTTDVKTYLKVGFEEGHALHTMVQAEVSRVNREMYSGVLGIDEEFDADVRAEDEAGESS